MTHTFDRRQLLTLAAAAVVPLQLGRHDEEAASIRAPWAIVQQTHTFTVKTPAGPRTAAVRGVSLYRVERGLVAEWWDYYDAAGYQRQVQATGPGAAR